MAQFTTPDGSTLVSTLWPTGLPRYIRGDYAIGVVQANNKLVSHHIDALRDWCYVAKEHKQGTHVPTYFLAYTQPDAETGAAVEVTLRFQGVVKDADLGVYGTWRGSKETAMQASQRIILVGGTMREVHNVQIAAASMLRRYVLQDMNVETVERGRLPSQLVFTRPVFDQVTPTTIRRPPPVDPNSDLSVKAAAITSQWMVGERVRLGVQEQNEVRPAAPREIRKGDFVDITATISISRRRKSGDVVANYCPLKIVRLATMSTVMTVAPKVAGDSTEVRDEHAVEPGNNLTQSSAASASRRAACSDSEL